MEAVETAMSEALRGVKRDLRGNGDEERRPGMADEPLDEAQVESRGSDSVQVEPGGETVARRNWDIMHECADAGTDDRAEEAHSAVQFEAERSATCRDESIAGERWSAMPHGCSTTTDRNNQRTSTGVNDVPSPPPVPPPPLERPPNAEYETPSIELEGERRYSASCEVGPTSAKMNAPRASEGDKDPRN